MNCIPHLLGSTVVAFGCPGNGRADALQAAPSSTGRRNALSAVIAFGESMKETTMLESPRDRSRASDDGASRAASRRRRWALTRSLSVACVLVATASCVYHQPVAVYPSGPSKFDRSWNAARAAADDVGVTVTDVDRARGTIHGYKGASDVTITLWQQADGSVRVGFNVRAPSGPDAVLADHLSNAFDRRMHY